MSAPIGLQHVNLSVPAGLKNDDVPHLQKDVLLWEWAATVLSPTDKQIHISFEKNPLPSLHKSSRHPCFALPDGQALVALQRRIHEHKSKGSVAAAMECDEPGQENSGSKGIEYPERFFARDYAGNRLEFAVHSM